MSPTLPSTSYGFGHWLAMVTFVAGVTLLVMVLLRSKQLPRRTFLSLLILSVLLLAGAIALAILMNTTVGERLSTGA